MLSRRSFLVLGAVVLSITTLGAPTAEALGRLHHGHAAGSFDLPDRANDGHIRGQLSSRGQVRLLLMASSVATSATEGNLEGVLVRPGATPGSPPFALVRGSYVTDRSGQRGRFRLVVLKPDRTGTNPPRRIGAIHGSFLDDQPNGTPGHFRGDWGIR